jgi:hypothetical protein
MPADLHPLLFLALRHHGLIRFFNSLSPTLRNDFDYRIRSVKKESTRLRRLEQTIELLTIAMQVQDGLVKRGDVAVPRLYAGILIDQPAWFT